MPSFRYCFISFPGFRSLLINSVTFTIREEFNPLIPMDRVITISYQLPPEQLILDEDTRLSQVEEEAILKCSEAENMVSTKAYSCLKQIIREVRFYLHKLFQRLGMEKILQVK